MEISKYCFLFFKKPLSPFGKEFRTGYKNAWVNNIKDYKP